MKISNIVFDFKEFSLVGKIKYGYFKKLNNNILVFCFFRKGFEMVK